MLKSDEYKMRIKDIRALLNEAGASLKIEENKKRLAELKAELEKPEVWGDIKKSQKISREVSAIENKVAIYEKGEKAVGDTEVLLEFAEMEEDESILADLDTELELAEKEIEEMHLQALLRGKYDSNDAIMTLHSGAGGTEACDWTEILYRMYICYAEIQGFTLTELDRLDGDGAGLKSVSFKIAGNNAYGYLKAEKGVHRLVRISPFDANKRRQTSFASVEVMPEITDDDEIEIRPEDIKVDTYRSSGAGGQKVNKTDSAVRITHLATGIVVQCQNERSQTQNKEMCMCMLMSKLIERREAERLEKEKDIKGEIKKIEWGSQIRSYVFCPYTMVKDHRTNYETGDITRVMDGEIQDFIIEYLRKS